MKGFELEKKFGVLGLAAFIVFSITTVQVRAFYNEGGRFYKKVDFIEDVPKLSVIIEEDSDWKETYVQHANKTDSDEEYSYTYDEVDYEYTTEDTSVVDNGTEDKNIENKDA